MKYFEDLLKDRKNPHEIDSELIIRKMLENNTNYSYEFQKNGQYDYDIGVYKYYINAGNYEKVNICFIEVELSEAWKTNYPNFWHNYSFLRRKVNVFDRQTNRFTDELKPNAEKTLYIIFNKTMTDAAAIQIKDIPSVCYSKFQNVTGTGSIYDNTFWRTPLTSNHVTRGLENTFQLIRKFITEHSQTPTL